MRKVARVIQFATGIHRVHHINWSYGWKLPIIKVGHFNDWKYFGFKRIKGHGIDYHDCTKTGIY